MNIIQATGLDEQWDNYFLASVRRRDWPNVQYIKDMALKETTSHLVVGVRKRTVKLLCALASGKPLIFCANHLKECIQIRKFDVDPSKHDLGCQPAKNDVFIAHHLVRKAWAENGGFFVNETVVILLKDQDLKNKTKRILTFGGAKVLDRTVNHLLHYFDPEITLVVTEPSLIDEDEKYKQFSDACEVPMVSVAYIEESLTTPVRPDKKLFSIFSPEIRSFDTKLNGFNQAQPVHNRQRCGSPDFFSHSSIKSIHPAAKPRSSRPTTAKHEVPDFVKISELEASPRSTTASTLASEVSMSDDPVADLEESPREKDSDDLHLELMSILNRNSGANQSAKTKGRRTPTPTRLKTTELKKAAAMFTVKKKPGIPTFDQLILDSIVSVATKNRNTVVNGSTANDSFVSSEDG